MTARPNIAAALAVDGWMHDDELAWLADQASRARSIIEVGCWKGRSTLALADHTPGRVYAVDTWNGSAGDAHCAEIAARGPDCIWNDFRANLARHIVSGVVFPMRAESVMAARFFERQSQDLIFLDGGHQFEEVQQDIQLYEPLVKQGGILAGHDYNIREHPGVKQAVDQAFGRHIQQFLSIWWMQL